ncbi:hypothetical protein [Streptomyces misionensis]|uniref:hypothetical protein n=1 Tax=Streptomyces misionensis TaxID=67331 RepID=UPI00396BE8E7
MGRAHREPLGPQGVVLRVRGRADPPPLRFEVADAGRLLLRQGARILLLGRVTEGNQGVCLRRYEGYRSPLPPVRSALMRDAGDWAHTYARRLEEAPEGPLYEARWHLGVRHRFPPYVWHGEDFVREWPGCHLDWSAAGWNGVVPLRRLSPPDAARVKAYRKHARAGTLAPVLLWWVTCLDGWLLLDGHDRAVAALAEGMTPPCVVLTGLSDEEDWRREADEVAEAYRLLLERPAAGDERRRQVVLRAYGEHLGSLPREEARTRSWPLVGGVPVWDALAVRAVFQCPGD